MALHPKKTDIIKHTTVDFNCVACLDGVEQNDHTFFLGGSKGQLKRFKWMTDIEDVTIDGIDDESIDAIAFSRSRQHMCLCLSNGDIHTVKIYQIPSNKMLCMRLGGQSTYTAASYLANDAYLAIGDEFGTLYICNMLYTQKAPIEVQPPEAACGKITSMTSDGHNLICVSYRNGTVAVFTKMGEKVYSTKATEELSLSESLICSLNENNELLAIPKQNEITILSTANWETKQTLKEDLVTNIISTSFDQNGKRLCCGTVNGILYIWEKGQSETMFKLKGLEGKAITHIYWQDYRSIVAFANGSILSWQIVGIEQFPQQQQQQKQKQNAVEEDMFADIDDDILISLAKSENMQVDATQTTKSNEPTTANESTHEKAAAPQVVVQTKELEPVVQYVIKPVDVSVQPPLMPSSSPLERKNRFLGFNASVGYLTSVSQHDVNVITAVMLSGRKQSVKNLDNCSLGAIGPNGFVIGSTFTAHYFPHNSAPATVNQCKWSKTFYEKIYCVATGEKFVTVCLEQIVYVFSLCGLLLKQFVLPGTVVSNVARGMNFDVIYQSGNDYFAAQLEDVNGWRLAHTWRIPLSQSVTIYWAGLTEMGLLGVIDSSGNTFICSPFGDWLLVHQLKLPQRWSQEKEEEEGREDEDEDTEAKEKEKSRETFWPVEINDINSTKQLVVVKLAEGEMYPMLSPMPVLHQLSFFPPLPGGSQEFERQFILKDFYFRCFPVREHLVNRETAQRAAEADVTLLMGLKAACESGSFEQALDIFSRLRLSKSIKIAIATAQQTSMISLAEEMSKQAEQLLVIQQAPGTPRRATPRKVSPQWNIEAESASVSQEAPKDSVAPQNALEESTAQQEQEQAHNEDIQTTSSITPTSQALPVNESAIKAIPSPKPAGKRMFFMHHSKPRAFTIGANPFASSIDNSKKQRSAIDLLKRLGKK